jgi:hypothetical protein
MADGLVNFVVSKQFFDRDAVQSVINRNERRYLIRSGSYIRTSAMNSIKRPPKPKKKKRLRGGSAFEELAGSQSLRNSAPGNPPFNQTGRLKYGILYGYNQASRSVVIGPKKLGGGGGVNLLTALEYGGNVKWKWKDPLTKKKETGTRYLKARPFMRPALDNSRNKLMEFWKQSIK